MNDKKVFLILGASSDLGVALTKKLNELYSDSVFCLHYHSDSSALEAIDFSKGNSALFLKADFTSKDEVSKLIQDLKEKDLVPTHVVHLPAGKLNYTRLKDFDEDRLDRNLRIQVYSFVEILKEFLPAMAKRKDHNKVVAVLSSVVNGQPPKSMLEYTAVKSMLLGVVKQLASDYTGKLVNINAVSPSMIDTKLLSEVDPRIIELSKEGSAEKRNATVDDIVPSICFLLSSDSNYLNGVNLNVTNGNIII
jgi:3-oxoacyl-[acyl-carrier protein] reductase